MTHAATDQEVWVISEAYRASPVALAISFGMSPWEVECAQRRHAQLMAKSTRISRESWESVAAELVGAAG